MDQKRLLVIAFKYNDILYALGTNEFQEATYKELVIFYVKGRNPKDFPLQGSFDSVNYIKYHSSLMLLWLNLLKIRFKSWRCDVLTFSNPILLAIKLISKLSKAKKVLWLEDGLMNYYPLSDISYSSSQRIKLWAQAIFRLKDEVAYGNKEQVTYLLCPDMAVSYWGAVKQLCFNIKNFKTDLLEKLSFLDGRSFFIGQPLYYYNNIRKEDYESCVNEIIKKYRVDYYVPHFGSGDEKINCPFLDLQKYHITFEFLACAYQFTLYSINSTLLYSTKKINPQVNTYMVNLKGIDNNKVILQKTVNGIIES